MGRSSSVFRMHAGAGLVATCLAITSGCTMCPDPLDYAGPVPNGSSPQNDFRARSNGILPLGAAPKPWPEIVSKAPPPAADEPTLAAALDPSFDVATDSTPVSVLVDETDTTVIAAGPPVVGPQDRRGETATSGDEDVVAMLLPPQEQPVPVTPPVRESPGWKRRR